MTIYFSIYKNAYGINVLLFNRIFLDTYYIYEFTTDYVQIPQYSFYNRKIFCIDFNHAENYFI